MGKSVISKALDGFHQALSIKPGSRLPVANGERVIRTKPSGAGRMTAEEDDAVLASLVERATRNGRSPEEEFVGWLEPQAKPKVLPCGVRWASLRSSQPTRTHHITTDGARQRLPIGSEFLQAVIPAQAGTTAQMTFRSPYKRL